jgi:membrane protein DedA with SNARE-associated domain
MPPIVRATGFGDQAGVRGGQKVQMEFDQYVHLIIDYVRLHQVWAAPIVFVLCFAESLAFVSLLIPAWGVLVALGAVISASGLNFWPILVAGAVGAALGDWLSYWVGLKLENRVYHMWPLSQHPNLIPAGEAFIRKWGSAAIFIARFSGPLRASVPIVAGVFAMPYWRFQIANFTSAFIWAAVLLSLGDVTSMSIKWIAEKLGG